MLLDWIILLILIVLPIVTAVKGKRAKEIQPSDKSLFYIIDACVIVILLALFFLLKPSLFYTLDFSKIDKGVHINDDMIAGILPLFFIPFFLAFTPWSTNYPKEISSAKELFGYPVIYLPDTTKEYLIFVIYIIIGVLFEELVCRQFIFHSLNSTLHLSGDYLVVFSSLLFAAGHLYQGLKGILSNFVLGLILGKIFLIKELLAYPIVLHLFLNLTLAVLAFRRIRDLKWSDQVKF